MDKLRIVVCAVNLTEGGPLTVLRECLASAVTVLPSNFELIALVNNPDLINEPRVRVIPLSSPKKSWFHRLFFEWIVSDRISRELKPALWLSLHDITPRVSATRQAVYCHNPSPFSRINLREAFASTNIFIVQPALCVVVPYFHSAQLLRYRATAMASC